MMELKEHETKASGLQYIIVIVHNKSFGPQLSVSHEFCSDASHYCCILEENFLISFLFALFLFPSLSVSLSLCAGTFRDPSKC